MNEDLKNLIWNRIDGVYMEQEVSERKKMNMSHFSFGALCMIMLKLAVALFVQYKSMQHVEKVTQQNFVLIESLSEIQRQLKIESAPPTEKSDRYRIMSSPHVSHLKRFEASAKMELRRIVDHIMRDEGKRSEPYADNIGVAVGVGRNLTTNGLSNLELRVLNPQVNLTDHVENISIGDKRIYVTTVETAKKVLNTPLSDHNIAFLLLSDLHRVAGEARDIFKEVWEEIDKGRREAVVDTLFNLGKTNFLEFEKTIASIKAMDWKQAAENLLLSLAARQNPARYHRIAKVLETGDVKHFED